MIIDVLNEVCYAFLAMLYSIFTGILLMAAYIGIFYFSCRFLIWLIKFTFERELIYLRGFIERLLSKSSQ